MNTRRIIKELYGKAFDQGYVDTLKAAYKADVEEGLFTAEEADYSKAVPYLEEHLSSEQKEILKAIEQRYENRWDYATQYPFVCGLMHAFEQFFSRDEEYLYGYDKAISEGMCTNPGMQRHGAFCSDATEVCVYLETLEANTDEETVEHITSIACAWDQRIHSATIHSYYLGYQAGLTMIDVVKPLSSMYLMEKTLYLEYQLGFTEPYSMRESRKERQAD